jgi:hypothetical protein
MMADGPSGCAPNRSSAARARAPEQDPDARSRQPGAGGTVAYVDAASGSLRRRASVERTLGHPDEEGDPWRPFWSRSWRSSPRR